MKPDLFAEFECASRKAERLAEWTGRDPEYPFIAIPASITVRGKGKGRRGKGIRITTNFNMEMAKVGGGGYAVKAKEEDQEGSYEITIK